MSGLARRLPRLAAFASCAALVLLMAGCSQFDGPQNTFSPEGEVAEDQKFLFLFVTWIALPIMILVLGATVYAAIRFRRKSDDDPLPKQVHGNTALELTWTIIPIILLVIIAVPTLDGVVDLGDRKGDAAFNVKITGTRFTWEFDYNDVVDADGAPIFTTDELHVPVGAVVAADIEAKDVLHSFWIPRLAGKQDAVPGRTNYLWFQADKPGTYDGQCAEFCGTGHSNMRMRVVVHTAEDFRAWAAEQGGTLSATLGER
jgi:cytochrome c oxidase subunit 2